MPIYADDSRSLPSLDKVPAIDLSAPGEQPEAPGWGAMAGAALRQGSDIVSAWSNKTVGVDMNTPEDGFDSRALWESLQGTKYESRFSRFAPIRNRAGAQAMKDQIDMEDDDKRTIAASGGWGIATEMGASLLSPFTFIPGGAMVNEVRLGSRVLKSALMTGAATGVAAGAQEMALGETQVTRETNVPMAIGAGALFGTFIGAGAGALMTRAERMTATKALEGASHPDWDKGVVDAVNELQADVRSNLSAGATETATLDDLSIAGNAASKWSAKTKNLNPVLRTMQSPNVETRRVAAQIMDNAVALKMNLAGEGEVAAETAMQRYTRGSVAQAVAAQREAYSEVRKLGNDLSDTQFRGLVGQAMRRGDQSNIPGVTEAARAWRKYVFDPLKDRAIELGMLPKDVNPKTAVSYLTRMYNRPLIMATEKQFKGVIRDWVAGGAQREIRRNPEEFAKFANKADFDAYIDEIVQNVFDHVTGKRDLEGTLPKDLVITERGPLAARTLTIPDERIEKWLEHDIELIGRRYARVMAADTELKARFGDPSMQGQLQAIADEYRRLRGREKDPEKLARLHKQERSDMRDIKAVRDMLRGSYLPDRQGTNVARITRAAMTFNYMRALGGLLASNLGDAVRPAAVHGLAPFLKDGLVPLITNLKAFKLSAKEAKLAGAVTERVLQGRIATLADLTDPYANGSLFERFIDNAANLFTKLTLINEFTDFNKSVAAVMTQNRLLRNAQKAAKDGFDSLPKDEKAFMGYLGIGKGKAEDLGKVFAQYGEDDGGVLIAHTDDWAKGHEALRSAFYGAVNKEVDRTIVTPATGDVPLAARDPVAKALFQFRTFTLAANQRMLINGLQQGRPGAFLSGLLSMAIPGMFVYWLKNVEGGREVSDNPLVWIAEGLDRSGMFGLAFEANNAFEKLGGPGLYWAAGKAGQTMMPGVDAGDSASRYQSRDSLGAFFPMVDLAQSGFGAASIFFNEGRDALEGEDVGISRGQMRSLRRLTPFASLPYWRWAIDNYVVPRKGQNHGGL